ncbi:periplasmic heavy metal sensor [Pseudotabrizicola formosa]|uniref:periplasmic heavy metal sensor n=1 Tax=Pseudotabrizicola formosa TaxID=2030009 RepID=UPI000CD0787E|nr:periplasmic heavy metal sensor [Pseudotabrizicola formosa]
MTDLPPPVSSASASARPPGRGLKLLLAVSLALNLAVLGTFAGVALRGHDPDRRPPAAVRDLSFGPFTEALTRDQRRAMLRSLSERGPGLREMRAQMRADFDDVLATLRATPFDAGAFQAAVARQNSRFSARAEAGRDALVALVLQMSDPERAAFLDRLEQALDRSARKGRGDAPRRD